MIKGCTNLSLGKFTLWLCNPWESYEAKLIREYEQEVKNHERELDLEREQELDWEQPLIIEQEVIQASVFYDWDFYAS